MPFYWYFAKVNKKSFVIAYFRLVGLYLTYNVFQEILYDICAKFLMYVRIKYELYI